MPGDTVSASAVVDAPADEVFAFITRPANHPEISGDLSVKSERHGAEQLTAVGDRFGMSMKMFGVPYRVTNTVVEFEPGRKVAWCHPGKHRWRWELESLDDGRTRVTETFDMSPSPLRPALRLFGYPEGHRDNVEKSVGNVADHFSSSSRA
jgi:uncharacterized protein YndB with AHSA1/START domain